MNISAIHLENFKTFKGVHKIEGLDENLSPERNIILIGGLNGAGKTTLIEALMLCFYGIGAKHLYPTKGAKNENYTAYILSLLNNDIKNLRLLKQEVLSVEVFLSNVDLAGNVNRSISLKRTWKINTTKNTLYDETFEILENGKIITDIEQGEYEETINSILPYNISQFFFFDGEKIQDFASDPESEFTKSLKDILGISLYGRLYDDIKQVRGRIITEANKNKDAATRKKELELELQRENDKISDNRLKIKVLEDEIDEIVIRKEKLNADTKRLTGISAESRDEFKIKKAELTKEQEVLEREYINQSKNYLPFILSKNLCEKLESQLEKEDDFLRRQAAEEQIKPRILGIIERIFDNNPPPPIPLSQEQELFYRQKIETTLKLELAKIGETSDTEFSQLIHQLSPSDAKKLRSELGKIRTEVLSPLREKMMRLKEIEIELEKTRKSEREVGDNKEDILKLFDNINTLGQQEGEKRQQIRDLEFDISESERKQANLKGDITEKEKELDILEKHKMEIKYCDTLCDAIEDFQKKYQTKKAEYLEESILDMWTKLARKEGQLSNLKIFPDDNFDIKLFDADENEIDKTKLSAGEREIYAIALLWALVQVSGKQIPIVIDTPYGRLDSKHRTAIAKEYFPNASHQVFLLSQDEEIVGEYYEILKPHISKELTILFDESMKCSKIVSGYAFKKNTSYIDNA